MKVPDAATEMFAAANQISGLDAQTLPSELIPLNATQLARGLLNFTTLQTLRGWVLPYWAHRQYDPHSDSFVPRSHLGLSMNVTQRNWTGVGNPRCTVEPIVDPRGLVTPFRNGWSIDVWLVVDGTAFFPSHLESVHQELVSDLPIVRTSFDAGDIRCTLTSYTQGERLFHEAEVRNAGGDLSRCVVAFSVRPFNPEGVSLVRRLRYIPAETRIAINESEALLLDAPPDVVAFSTMEAGDCAMQLTGPHTDVQAVDCSKGLATVFAGYHIDLHPGESSQHGCSVALDAARHVTQVTGSVGNAVAEWETILAGGSTVTTPEPEINATLRACASSLLMLTDGADVTPGPFTYHQFWFRDAAYILSALDKFGFADYTGPIVRTFPSRQERTGFFRSQKGEWDSNGQALWTVWQHTLRSGTRDFLESLFPSLLKGVQWIDETRLKGPKASGTPYSGLLPVGLSAEHLGFADHYFWDNAWSIAGIEAFTDICGQLGRSGEKEYAEKLAAAYRNDLERSLRYVRESHQVSGIPASPARRADCGMIGSCCFWYPLQILPSDDARMSATVRTLVDHHCLDGLFFQEFIHSGMNPYLTLHLAQALLHQGKREAFWAMLTAVLARGTPTRTYPEAIHPITGRGAMGDGHHGWAAAEVLHALRDAFVRECRDHKGGGYDLTFCAGIPPSWFASPGTFGVKSTHTLHGILSLSIQCERHEACIRIEIEGGRRTGCWNVVLPLRATEVVTDGGGNPQWTVAGNETHISLAPAPTIIRVRHASEHLRS